MTIPNWLLGGFIVGLGLTTSVFVKISVVNHQGAKLLSFTRSVLVALVVAMLLGEHNFQDSCGAVRRTRSQLHVATGARLTWSPTTMW